MQRASVGKALHLDMNRRETRQPDSENDVSNPDAKNYFHRGLYSRASGLDVVGILVKVATRKNPNIQLGVVDLSCAMVVCAADLPDEPIIYCSEGFETLTQYRSNEVLGQNCRFLQAASTPAGVNYRPHHVASDLSVKAQLQMDVAARQETQVEVLNYKKNGEPFMNILSIVPVTWDSDQVKYLVGFMAANSPLDTWSHANLPRIES
ncbi:hypothetical protein BDV96DRAFT_641116 [Lophiotrema nucula]|uniref:PAS domain-containing protein n=1 Tax=Lophiotrema nucula TaxID=690887 RepID=A0A6A5ZMH1_9PLEO|nr:hypothetical protein BDV96DRAFT_641116 [Lophiotrema nucula]